MGKEHLYIWEMTPGMLHENDAAERLRRMPLPGLSVWEIKRAKDARCRGGRLCPPDEQLQICAAPLMLHWRGSAPWLPLRAMSST